MHQIYPKSAYTFRSDALGVHRVRQPLEKRLTQPTARSSFICDLRNSFSL
jgi:hypothetical protein